MAFSGEAANLVWQRVKISLDSLGAVPAAVDAFRGLKADLAQAQNNPNLQFVAMSDIITDTVILAGAGQLYGVFLKKQATSTVAYFKMADHATVAGGGSGANMSDTIELQGSGDNAWLIFPRGRVQTTGLTVASETTGAGGADTTTGDGPNGFVVIGA